MSGLNYLSEPEWVIYTIEEELGNPERLVAPLASNNVNNMRSCIPPYRITPAKAVGIVKDWLRHHDDQSYFAADALVAEAPQNAFPCE